MVVDALAEALGVENEWRRGKHGLFTWCRYRGDNHQCYLIKPLMFVNRSGDALACLKHIGIVPQEVTVIYDNLDLTLGSIKLKHKGGDGGHNGIASIINAIGGAFQRIAIGIGRPLAKSAVHDYVLAIPPEEERHILSGAIRRICDSYLQHPTQSFAARMEYLHQNVG